MPVSPSYPGLYIEELPSTSRTIASAPTSIAVFIGYTHPFKTKNPGRAVQIFSFSDYEREFGGFYVSNVFDRSVAEAVYLFFLNGGGNAYVVGIVPDEYRSSTGSSLGTVAAATATHGGIVFTAREPTDVEPIKIKIDNVTSTGDAADVTIAYGSMPPETYRGVSVTSTSADFFKTRMAGSAYVTVSGTPAAFTAVTETDLEVAPPANTVSTFESAHFTDALKTDGDLDKVPIFNLLILPGRTENSLLSAALAFAERKHAFVIVDPPKASSSDPSKGADYIATAFNTYPKSPYGALYFPYLKSSDPLTGNEIEVAPSGVVAGIYARTDTNRGVWKAPAGLETTILNTTGVVDEGRMTDMRQGVLNLIGINAIRTFPVTGTVVFGARTLVGATENSAFEAWRYVPVRRTANFIEQTLLRNLGWAIFEPNDEPLWVSLRVSVENFMLSLFSRGAFQGSKPSQAFLVRCDSSTTTQTDINNGKVNILVGFAPLKPAEFVIIQIAQLAGQAQS